MTEMVYLPYLHAWRVRQNVSMRALSFAVRAANIRCSVRLIAGAEYRDDAEPVPVEIATGIASALGISLDTLLNVNPEESER